MNYFYIKREWLWLLPIAIILFFIAGFREFGIDKDSLNYIELLDKNIRIFDANFLDKEPAFWLINEINHIIFNGSLRAFFILFAFLGVFFKVIVIKKYSDNVFLSILVYISLFFILHEMTQIRAGISIAVVYLAINDIVNRNLRNFILKLVIAAFFHYSALIFVFLYFINSRKINRVWYFSLPLIGILIYYFNFFQSILLYLLPFFPDFISHKLYIYFDMLNKSEVNIVSPLNLGNLFLLFTLWFNIIFLDKRNAYHTLFVKMLSIGFWILFSFSFIEVIGYRLSNFLFFTLVFLIPITINKFKNKLPACLFFILFLLYSLCKNYFVMLY